MDIIGRIDSTVEAWERGADAARWAPEDGRGARYREALMVITEEPPAGWRPIGEAGNLSMSVVDDVGFDREPDPEWAYMAMCRACDQRPGDDRVRVFQAHAARAEWDEAHRGPDHEVWLLAKTSRTTLAAAWNAARFAAHLSRVGRA